MSRNVEFLSTAPCTFLDMETPSIGPYPSREGHWSFYPWPMDGVSMSGNVQGSMDKNSRAPPWRDTGQWMEFPCPEMCRDLWIKTLEPLPGGIQANRWSFHVQKCVGVCG